MSPSRRPLPRWFGAVDLGCTAAAAGLWFVAPELGPAPLVLALAPWAARLVWSGRLTRRTPYDLPLALFLAIAAVSVWTAFDRSAAWSKLWLLVGAVLLFYALANAESLGLVRVGLLAALGAGVSLAFLATHDWQALPAKVEALTRLGKALQAPLPPLSGGGRLHPNIVGGALAVLLPFAGLAVIEAGRQARRAAGPRRAAWALATAGAALALLIAAFGLVMTTSRGAWLALAAGLGMAGLWLLSGRLSRGHPDRRAWLFPALLLALLLAALGAVLVRPGLVEAAWSALPGSSTGGSRLDLLRNTVRMVGDYPLLGAGLGSFPMFYSTYVLLLHVGYITHSHNLFLDVAVEQGLLALAVLAWAWAAFGRAVWQKMAADRGGPVGLPRRAGQGRPGATEVEKDGPVGRRGGTEVGQGAAAAAGAAALALGVMLLHGLVDDALYSSRAALILFVPLAFALPPGTQERAARRPAGRRRWLALPVALLALLVLALVARRPLLSRAASNLGAVRQGQAELTPYSWPEWPIQDEVRRVVDLRRPIALFEWALAQDARNATANRRLGMIELSLGRYPQALAHLQAAYAAEPGSNTVRQLLGEALIANGRVDEGRALWSTVRRSEGQLEARIFWYGHIGDAQRAEWMRSAAGDGP